MVHSSFKSIGEVDGGPQTVIDSLLEILGENGTLIMPTYTLSYCSQFNKTGMGFFDVDESASEMGILSEYLRHMPNSIRTINPIHSVTAIGKYAHQISEINAKDSFGPNSVFSLLHKLNAKIMIIGLSFDDSLTFFHYVEQSIGVSYRYLKKFSGDIVSDGKKYQDSYTMYVKNLEHNIKTNYNDLGNLLEKNNLVKKVKIGKSTVKVMNSQNIYPFISSELKNNPSIVFEFKNKDNPV